MICRHRSMLRLRLTQNQPSAACRQRRGSPLFRSYKAGPRPFERCVSVGPVPPTLTLGWLPSARAPPPFEEVIPLSSFGEINGRSWPQAQTGRPSNTVVAMVRNIVFLPCHVSCSRITGASCLPCTTPERVATAALDLRVAGMMAPEATIHERRIDDHTRAVLSSVMNRQQ